MSGVEDQAPGADAGGYDCYVIPDSESEQSELCVEVPRPMPQTPPCHQPELDELYERVVRDDKEKREAWRAGAVIEITSSPCRSRSSELSGAPGLCSRRSADGLCREGDIRRSFAEMREAVESVKDYAVRTEVLLGIAESMLDQGVCCCRRSSNRPDSNGVELGAPEDSSPAFKKTRSVDEASLDEEGCEDDWDSISPPPPRRRQRRKLFL